MTEEKESLAGRQWLVDKVDNSIKEGQTAIPAIENGICQRCGSSCWARLPSGFLYCRACVGLGRLDEGKLLVRQAAGSHYPARAGMTWTGQLQERQEGVSHFLLEKFAAKEDCLVEAVTGAGKTEMIFPLLAEAFSRGCRVAIATPRIDVVNELYPRLVAAFGEVEIGKYHGREEKQPANEQLVICTTHQLFKYYQAFDLLIIDEIDSFPYAGNPQLHFAAGNAVKKTGSRVFLTATPPEDLVKAARQGKLAIVRLNRRFHGYPLPVPQLDLYVKPFLTKGRLHPKLARRIKMAAKSGHPLLVFLPRIAQMPQYFAAVKRLLPNLRLATVYAQDPDRLEKVEKFRKGDLDLLLTTTILERGVTFKHVWVIIVAADDEIYSAASLVQIAGRVGRDKQDPDGLVLFCYRRYSRQIRSAVKQIKEMNRG
ncbi:DEAD/DEAH box helicase [uncultured Lactobacillus sp.]|uniref:DEAD/DEAH box helicase n=1 Tax=uncultured Lactobacillus sp. TaxID=153152 RepID=UPI0026151852|nr:DEAD/DEAH box helicase [uncultured Lactobacillus sp.]